MSQILDILFLIRKIMSENISKCPNCGGDYKYNPEKGSLACDKCGSQEFIETLPAPDKQFLTEDSAPDQVEQNADQELKCPNCGAPIPADQLIDTKCPFCGTSGITAVKSSMLYSPDCIIPFTINNDRAVEIYKQWIRKKKFAPNDLKKKSSLEKIQGVYYPCWLFDYHTDSHYHGVGVNVTTYRDSNGNTRTVETRRRFSGDQSDDYINQLEPANKMTNKNDIEQFTDFSHQPFVKYDDKYLLGYSTLNVDTPLLQGWGNERSQKQNEIANDIKRKLGFDRYDSFNCTTNFGNIKWTYSLLPMWICKFMYKKKLYNFLINGKTGNIKGKTPKSFWKIFFLVLGIIGGVGLIAFLIYFFG